LARKKGCTEWAFRQNRDVRILVKEKTGKFHSPIVESH